MKKLVKQGHLPEDWEGRRVGLLEALRFLRQQMLQGRGLWFIAGGDRADSLESFIHGWLTHSIFNPSPEEEWEEFMLWLRDIKGEVPPEGWPTKYLRDCGGNHERAAMKFLDLVEEFASKKHPDAPAL